MSNYKYTNQEAFDIAVRGVLGQGKPSVNEEDFTCCYRGPNGLKCAAGWILPDDLYDPEWDAKNSAWPWISKGNAKLTSLAPSTFVDELQRAHDRGAGDKDWMDQAKRNFRGVATRYGLSAAAVDEF